MILDIKKDSPILPYLDNPHLDSPHYESPHFEIPNIRSNNYLLSQI